MDALVPIPQYGVQVCQQVQAGHDKELIDLWLHNRPEHTQRSYRKAAEDFLNVVGDLRTLTLGALQKYADSLGYLKVSSRGTVLAAIKSLLSFAQHLAYTTFNVGAALRVPPTPDNLAARILPEETVLKLLGGERSPRNAALLRLLYVAGVRVSEVCALRWCDLQPAAEAGTGQITVCGKGSKTRSIKLTERCWEALQSIRGDSGPSDPVFRSLHRRGVRQPLDPRQVRRIVTAAATRAGLKELVSPHWFRHAHASHALDRGAPIHLVQATLGHSNMSTTGRYSHARPTDSSSRFLPA